MHLEQSSANRRATASPARSIASSSLCFALLALALLVAAGCSVRKNGGSQLVVFSGMCDASGAVPLSERLFAVADDEDNALRVYDVERGGAPLRAVDFSSWLELPVKPGKRPRASGGPETDIEAATHVGRLAYWITSHGRNASGKEKPERLRFFASGTDSVDEALEMVGRPYEGLLDDLLADPRYTRFGLSEASKRAPKSPGGLNIEGMTRREEGGVFIGFRSPVPHGRALLTTLLNPEAVVRGRERARFGPPISLDLGGLGVRGISSWRGRYLIIAGDPQGERESRLYTWDGQDAVRRVRVDLSEVNPEGFFSLDARPGIMLLSDDGTQVVAGRACKRQKSASSKRFRGMWLDGGALVPP